MPPAESIQERVIESVKSGLGLGGNNNIDADTALLGNLPEFDSQSVITVLSALEEEFDIIVEDEEVDASLFLSVGSLIAFIEQKLHDNA